MSKTIECEIPFWPPGPMGVAIGSGGRVLLRKGLTRTQRRAALTWARFELRKAEKSRKAGVK